MDNSLSGAFLASLFFLVTPALSISAERKDYPITPVSFTQVKVADAFWLPRIETNRTETLPFLFKKNEETGRLDNFAIAGGLMKGRYRGERYNDTDVYKPIEGASYSLMVHPDPDLDRALDAMIVKIAAAQEPDGYLFTARTCDPAHPQPGIGPERWVEEIVSHELYNAGHLYEAAVAHYLATGKRSLLDVAIRNADLVAATFGPDKRHGFPGHQEIELALVKLYRVTGDEKYLRLAKYFLDQRGREVKLTQYPPGTRFAIYNEPEQIQAHKPVLEQDEAVGHAVRLTYMASGMADIAALSGDPAYLGAVCRLWRNVVEQEDVPHRRGRLPSRPRAFRRELRTPQPDGLSRDLRLDRDGLLEPPDVPPHGGRPLHRRPGKGDGQRHPLRRLARRPGFLLRQPARVGRQVPVSTRASSAGRRSSGRPAVRATSHASCPRCRDTSTP